MRFARVASRGSFAGSALKLVLKFRTSLFDVRCSDARVAHFSGVALFAIRVFLFHWLKTDQFIRNSLGRKTNLAQPGGKFPSGGSQAVFERFG